MVLGGSERGRGFIGGLGLGEWETFSSRSCGYWRFARKEGDPELSTAELVRSGF